MKAYKNVVMKDYHLMCFTHIKFMYDLQLQGILNKYDFNHIKK